MKNDQVNTVPPEIKRFNWAAFFFNWIWSVRHGVWVGLWTFFPVLGWFFMPIILGFKGNEWAWKKNTYPSPEAFLQIQRKWTLGVLWIFLGLASLFLMMIGWSFYFFHYSDTSKTMLSILNQNETAVSYFGKNIQRDSFWGNNSYSLQNDVEAIEMNFKAKGSERSGQIALKVRIIGDQVVVDELRINPNEESSVEK